MFDNLVEVIKAYSYASTLKGNILSSPGAFGLGTGTSGIQGAKSNSPAANMVSNRYASTYYRLMQEIKDYEINDLTNTSLTIFRDYIKAYFKKAEKLITIKTTVPNYKKAERILNKIYKDLGVIDEVKEHLWDIIFHGAWNFKIAFDSENRRFVKFYLQNPHNVVTVKGDGGIKYHLVVSRDGDIYKVKPNSIFRIGLTELTLINDLRSKIDVDKKEDTLVQDEFMVAGMPLYYNITGKVKEFLLKEQILSLLSIKDLVQPLLLLVRLDKNTAPSEGNQLALNIENMINKYSDISSVLSSNFSINSLLDSLMNNIRVIPDYQSSMGDMNNIDLSKITNKINDIEQSQENRRDGILTSVSIPKALFNGESTKWDAIKSSQRLNSKVNSYVISIVDSLRNNAISMYKDLTGIELDKDDVEINLFTKTDTDFNTALTNTEIVGQLINGIQQILTSAGQVISDVKFIDPEQFANYVHNKLMGIDTDIDEFFDDKTIENFMKQQANEG